MHNVIQLCLAAKDILLNHTCINETMLSPSFDYSCLKRADHFASGRYSLKYKHSKIFKHKKFTYCNL